MTPDCPRRNSACVFPPLAISSVFWIDCVLHVRVHGPASPLLAFFSSGRDFPTACPCSGFPFCGPWLPAPFLAALPHA
eukprot:9256633-Heterocapsa_arctica.AAC.1